MDAVDTHHLQIIKLVNSIIKATLCYHFGTKKTRYTPLTTHTKYFIDSFFKHSLGQIEHINQPNDNIGSDHNKGHVLLEMLKLSFKRKPFSNLLYDLSVYQKLHLV
jgi:hypothetical protein